MRCIPAQNGAIFLKENKLIDRGRTKRQSFLATNKNGRSHYKNQSGIRTLRQQYGPKLNEFRAKKSNLMNHDPETRR
jgi:hypothetical protein